MIELTDAELDQVSGGQAGLGVGTAFLAQGGELPPSPETTPVWNARDNLSMAGGNTPSVLPPGHGRITAGVA